MTEQEIIEIIRLAVDELPEPPDKTPLNPIQRVSLEANVYWSVYNHIVQGFPLSKVKEMLIRGEMEDDEFYRVLGPQIVKAYQAGKRAEKK